MFSKIAAAACGFTLALSGVAASAQDAAQLYLAKGCVACHGPNGSKGLTPMYPKVAGQNAAYLEAQMKDIKSGARDNGQSNLMKPIMTNVSDEEIAALAQWLSEQPPQ